MDSEHELQLEGCYAVCVKPEAPAGLEAEDEEETICADHEEAELLRQELHRKGRSCVIRYIGPAGGGD